LIIKKPAVNIRVEVKLVQPRFYSLNFLLSTTLKENWNRGHTADWTAFHLSSPWIFEVEVPEQASCVLVEREGLPSYDALEKVLK